MKRPHQCPAPRAAARLHVNNVPWRIAFLFALLGTILLHGCHGEDDDHELFLGSAPESVWLLN